MQSLSSIFDIADRYDALLLDLWGVVHDGSHLYPGVHDTLTRLRAANKKIIFVSNAPRRAHVVATRLGELGIEPALYDDVVSSGEAGFQWLAAGKAPFGKNYFFIGPQRDANVLDGLDYKAVSTLGQADFLLNVGFGSEEQTTSDYSDILQNAAAQNLPMLCLNPDLEVVKLSGECFPCAGVLAKEFEVLGGDVIWFGKPYETVYAHSHILLGNIPKEKILAVGDSLETDIPGAQNYGINSLLITGGILKKHSVAEIQAMCAELGLKPNYITAAFT